MHRKEEAKLDEIVPLQCDVDAKRDDACRCLTVRHVFCSTAYGAVTGFYYYRSPATHWSLIAFGAAYGIASAYTDCSRIFDSSSTKSQLPKISEPIIPQDGQE